MSRDYWRDAMQGDYLRRRRHQLDLLAARRQPGRPHESIKGLLKKIRTARANERHSTTRWHQLNQRGVA